MESSCAINPHALCYDEHFYNAEVFYTSQAGDKHVGVLMGTLDHIDYH